VSRPILVTGIGGPTGRSLADQLVSRGFTVLGVDLAPVTHAGVRCERVPAATDPAFLGTLRRIAADAGARLVIPTVTEEITVPGLGAPGGARVVVGPRPAVTVAADRWFTCRRLTAARVPVPRHALPSHVPTPADVTANVGRPFLSRPRSSRCARGVAVHGDPVTAGIELMDDTTILQEYAPGQEYAVNLYLARNPGHDLAVVLARTRPARGHVGPAMAVRRVSAPDVAEVAHRAARAIGLTGPVAVGVRRAADGTPLVLEVDARFGAHSAHAHEVLDALLAEHLPALDVPAVE
jgi:carbamoylphosphate synthase large subunit